MRFVLPEEIDHHSAKEIVKILDRAIELDGIRSLELDFKKTNFMDSSGIGMVIGRCRKMEYFCGDVNLINCSPRIYRIMKASGLHRLVHIEEKKEEMRQNG